MSFRPAKTQPKTISAALDHLLGTMRAPSTDVLSAVFGRWPEIVGVDLAAHSRPTAIDGEIVLIVADDPAWAAELKWLRGEVVARVAEITETTRITDIRVRVDSGG